MMPDMNNIYSGSYSVVNQAWTPQAATTNATSYSTGAIDHSPAGNPLAANQNIQVGLGNPLAVWLEVTAQPGHAAAETYTVSLLTDSNPNLTTTPTVLASLSIPNTTPAGTIFVLVIPPSLNFQRYSGLKFVLADGGGVSSLSVIAFLLPVNMIQNWVTYLSGWTIENS